MLKVLSFMIYGCIQIQELGSFVVVALKAHHSLHSLRAGISATIKKS